jgi:hypothetical protein
MPSPTLPILNNLLSLAVAEKFPVLGIPIGLFVVAFSLRLLVNAPRIQEPGILPLERARRIVDSLQIGLELSIMSLGFYWRAAYSIPRVTAPDVAFLIFIGFITTIIGAALRIYASSPNHPWRDLTASNLVGGGSLVLSFLIVRALEVRP